MAIDYSKKKNVELEELLKGRSLPHTGKKADLVARLQDDDVKKSSVTSPTSAKPATSVKPTITAATSIAAATDTKPSTTAPATAPEDEIDWDEDDNITTTLPAVTAKTTTPALTSSAKASTSASTSPVKASAPASTSATKASASASKSAAAAGGVGPVSTPAAVSNQAIAIDPSKTHDLSVKLPEADSSLPAASEKPNEEAASPSKEYSLNLPPTSLEVELAKRAKRAALWKTGPADVPATDTAKADTTAKEEAAANDTTTSADASTKKNVGGENAANKVTESQAEADARKALERSKRFGTGQTAVKGLDEALPQTSTVNGLDQALPNKGAVKGLDEALPQRGTKRGRDNGEDGGRGGKRGRRNDGGARRGDSGRRENGGRRGAETNGRKDGNNREKRGADKGPAGDKAALREKDRLAAEARKKKFATAA